MSYQVVLQSEAIVDIQAAFDWYEEQRPGLGYELIEEIEDALKRLSKHPQHYASEGLILQIQRKNHSVRRLLTGFIRAAFRAWKLTVHKVMKSIPAPARTKIQGERYVWIG